MREKIIQAAITCAEKDGIRFTLADIATSMKISKKTIYKYFSGKEELIGVAIDYVFGDIHRQIDEIAHENLSDLEKLKRAVSVYPAVINLETIKMNDFVGQYPEIYKKIAWQLDANWEETLELYDVCVKKGLIKNIDREYFRAVLVGVFEQALRFTNHKDATLACLDAVLFGFAAGGADESKK